MALHETPGRSNEWYTPAYVFEALSIRFDLDVAGTDNPDAWVPANRRITSESLSCRWHGFVWMNPPFGGRNGLIPWLDKFFDHGDGVALVPDRTSAPWWQTCARRADSLLFVAGKIKFIPGPGATASSPAQGTTLLAAGRNGVAALANAERNGLGFVRCKRAA